MMNRISVFVICSICVLAWQKNGYPEAQPSPSPNLLRNSSFTQCTNPGIPDWWGTGAPENIENWEGCYGTDTGSPVSSTHSLRITNPLPNFTFGVQSFANVLPSGREYTLSVYLKGDPEGLPVGLSIGYDLRKEVMVTKEWQRYWLSGTTQKGHWAGSRLVVGFSLSKPGTIWVAAPQLEYGSQPTPYQPADIDKVPTPEPIKLPAPIIPTPALPIPEAKCIRTSTPPTIDGKLDDPCWKQAQKLSKFTDILTGKPASLDTECYLLYDTENLYLAFRCLEPDISQIKGKVTTRDGAVFSDDSVEIFIDPNPAEPDYLHFAANVLGTQYDAKAFDASWEADWQAATAKGEGEWTGEFALPFYSLSLTPKVKDIWRINLCRNRSRGEILEWSAWSCTYGSFHQPNRFGVLKGINRSIVERYSYEIKNLALNETPGDLILLTARILSQPPKVKEITVEAEFSSLGLKETSRVDKLRLKPKGTRINLSLIPSQPETRQYQVKLKLRGPKTNQVVYQTFQSFSLEVPSGLAPLRTAVELSYYIHEPKARVLIQSNLKQPAESNLEVTNLSSRLTSRLEPFEDPQIPAKSSKLLSYDISRLPAGEYEVEVAALTAKGLPIAMAKDKLIKLMPSSVEVKINRLTRSLLVNNKPFIAYAQGIHGFRSDWWLDDIKKHGFNSVVAVFPAYQSKEELDANEARIRHFLDECTKRNLMVISWMAPGGVEYQLIKEAVVKTIERFKDHRAILCWYLLDEPEGWWGQQEGGKQESDLIDLYKAAKAADPYRPSQINWYAWEKGKGGYGSLEATDIGSLDRYPIGKVENAMKSIADIASLMNEDCRKRNQPTAFWVQMYGYDDAVREPTPEEEKCMTYLCLIYGMRSVYYFIYKPMYPGLWESMKGLGEELKALEAVLSAEEAKELTFGTQKEVIHYTIWENKGKTYLIACNGSYTPVQATFDLKKLARIKPKNATVWFESRRLELKDGKLVDLFAPCARHVYELQ